MDHDYFLTLDPHSFFLKSLLVSVSSETDSLKCMIPAYEKKIDALMSVCRNSFADTAISSI